MTEQAIHTLTWSSNRGRYCFDDSESGQDLTTGDPLSIEVLHDVWVNGHISYSSAYDGPGCYQIADAGRPHPGGPTRLPREELTKEGLAQRIRAAAREGLSLADGLSAATGQTVGLFHGYYFVSIDGQVLGLCTGMRVRSRE